MKNSIVAAAIGITIVAAACASGPSGATESDFVASTTTVPASGKVTPSTTESVVSSVVDTTTTTTTTETADTTTTTETDSGEVSEIDAFFASLKRDDEMSSGRLEGSIRMSGLDPTEAGVTDGEILFAVSFDNATGDGSFLMDMSSVVASAGASSEQPFDPALLGITEVRQVGETAYVRFPFFTMMLGADTEWISMPAEDSDGFTGQSEQFPTDPDELLGAYEGADGTVEDLGVEQVNGVSATHVRVTFSTEAFLEELTQTEREELANATYFAVGDIPMDLWVSDDGYLVRLVFALDGDTLATDGSADFGSMMLRFDVFDINQPVVITPPPTDQVTDIDDIEGADFFDLSTEA